jgi:hypothetical protein
MATAQAIGSKMKSSVFWIWLGTRVPPLPDGGQHNDTSANPDLFPLPFLRFGRDAPCGWPARDLRTVWRGSNN